MMAESDLNLEDAGLSSNFKAPCKKGLNKDLVNKSVNVNFFDDQKSGWSSKDWLKYVNRIKLRFMSPGTQLILKTDEGSLKMDPIDVITTKIATFKGIFRRRSAGVNKKPVLIVGVTVGASAFSFFRGQLAWFRNQGWDTILVTTPDSQAIATAEREKVRLFGIPMERGISPYKDLVSLIRWVLFLVKERPQAVNVGTPKAGMLGVLAAWITLVPVRLYVVRGLRLEGSKGLLQKLLWLMEWITISLATDVLFVSESLYSEAERLKLINPKKCWLIGSGSSNGVDAVGIEKRILDVDRDKIRRSLGFSSSDFVAGFIGRVSYDKGAGVVLDAMASPVIDGRVRALIVGAIEDEQLGNRLKNAPNNVKHLPWSDDVWGLLPVIDVLCLPSVREGFPNVVLEAASAGVPAITTRATGAIDSVREGDTGILIDVGDISGLVKAINDMVSTPNQIVSMGLRAKKIVKEEFRPEDIWSGLLEILTRDSSPRHARRV